MLVRPAGIGQAESVTTDVCYDPAQCPELCVSAGYGPYNPATGTCEPPATGDAPPPSAGEGEKLCADGLPPNCEGGICKCPEAPGPSGGEPGPGRGPGGRCDWYQVAKKESTGRVVCAISPVLLYGLGGLIVLTLLTGGGRRRR